MSELKPCPFCGRKPSKVYESRMFGSTLIFFYVKCKAATSRCRVKPSTMMYKTAEEAIEAWNRRAGE